MLFLWQHRDLHKLWILTTVIILSLLYLVNLQLCFAFVYKLLYWIILAESQFVQPLFSLENLKKLNEYPYNQLPSLFYFLEDYSLTLNGMVSILKQCHDYTSCHHVSTMFHTCIMVCNTTYACYMLKQGGSVPKE